MEMAAIGIEMVTQMVRVINSDNDRDRNENRNGDKDREIMIETTTTTTMIKMEMINVRCSDEESCSGINKCVVTTDTVIEMERQHTGKG